MKRWSTLALALALAVLCSQDAFTFSFKSQLSKLANSNKRGTFSGGLSPKVHRRLVSSDRASLHTLFLDLDDVLEDDLDYLTQLRRQMQSSFSASPRELTNRIKDYFNNNKRTSDDHRAFQSYLEQNGQTMDSVNAIMLIEGCSKNGVAIESLISWEALLAAMDRPSAMMTSSMIYRGISVMKALDYKDSRVKKFFHALADRIDESNVVLNQCDICPSIYSLQSLNAYSFDTKRIIVYLTKCMAQTSIPFPTKAICSAIYGLKKMKPLPEVRGLVEQIATKIRDSETYFHSVNICIALNGLQHMDDNCPQVRKLMAALMDKAIPAEEQGMDRAGDREISMALFGLQSMGSSSPGKVQNSYQAEKVYVPRSYRETGLAQTRTIVPLDQYSTPVLLDPEEDDVDNDEGMQDSRPYRAARQVHANSRRPEISLELSRVLEYLSTLLQHYDQSFEAKRLGFAMMGLNHLSSSVPEVKKLLEIIAIKANGAWGEINGQELSMCMHGLMGAHSESAQVNALLHEIVPLIHKCPSMNADDARSAMYGLQGLHATSKEANAIFDAFADLLIRSRIVFRTPAEVSTALYGLQGLSSTDSPETRKLVGTITKLISEEPIRGTFSSRELSMSFYGLRASSSSSSDTRKILSVLTPEIHKFRGQLSCQDIASCLYGLQKLSSNSDEVVAAVGALAQHIPDASGKFNPKGLSMALNGLQGLSSKLPEVRQLVAGLKILLERTEPTFNGFDDFHQISSALFGLGNLRSEHVEVRELLEVVDRLLHRQAIRVGKGNTVVQTRHKLKIGEIPKPEKMGMALFGMQGLSPELEAAASIMDVLADYLEVMPRPSGKMLGMALQGFRSCSGRISEGHEKVLLRLAEKMEGWSHKKVAKGQKMKLPSVEDLQITIRSSLSGIQRIDRWNAGVQAVLVAMAREAMSNKWDLQRVLDQKTLSVAYEAYRRSVVKDQDPILTDFLSVLQAAMENIDNESGTLGQKIVGLGKESKDKSAEEHQDLDRNTQASPSAKKVYVPKRYPAKKNRERSRPVSKVTSSSI